MITGDEFGPNVLTFWLTVEGKPQKTSTKKLTRPGIEPGAAAWEVTMLPLNHTAMVPVIFERPCTTELSVAHDVFFMNWSPFSWVYGLEYAQYLSTVQRPLLRMSPTAGDETSRGRIPENGRRRDFGRRQRHRQSEFQHTDRPRPYSPELFNKDHTNVSYSFSSTSYLSGL